MQSGYTPRVYAPHPTHVVLLLEKERGDRHTSGSHDSSEVGAASDFEAYPDGHTYAPTTHCENDEEPVTAVVVPGGHERHATELVAPTDALYVDKAQGMHEELRKELEKEPATHSVQSAEPEPAKKPSGQSTQTTAVDAPAAGLAVPAGHGTQALSV